MTRSTTMLDATTVLANMRNVTHEGANYIDVAVEYPLLPKALKSASDKWSSRFSKLRLPSNNCIYTKFGNFNEPIDKSLPSKKSVLVPVDQWRSAIMAAVEKANKKIQKHTAASNVAPTPTSTPIPTHTPPSLSRPTDESVSREVPQGEASTEATTEPMHLDQIQLGVTEAFVYESRTLPIRAYGERKPDMFFLNFDDVMDAIAVRTDLLPEVIDVQKVLVNNNLVKVLSYDMLITLICLKAKNFPVATCLKRWIVHVTFHAQYGEARKVESQGVVSMRDGKFTREMYGLTETGREVLYMLDVCPGAYAMELYPEQVRAALPPGKKIDDFFVCKPGFTLDERNRISSNRTKLRKIFPKCDPRPIHSSEFPGISSKDLREMETTVFVQEFESQRIEGIVLNEEEQMEVYLFERADAQTAKNSMNMQSHRYIRAAIELAKQQAKDHEVEKIRMKQRIHDMESELSSVRKAALQVMPPETAKIVSTFWGMV